MPVHKTLGVRSQNHYGHVPLCKAMLLRAVELWQRLQLVSVYSQIMNAEFQNKLKQVH
jgi:hypothetical protein